MKRTGIFMISLGWLLVAGLLWWSFDRVLNPNANLANAEIENGEVVLQRGPDGHFRATGLVNGQPVDFLVDTGATSVALPERLARRLNLRFGPAERVHTANGEAVAYSTRLDQVILGGATAYDVSSHISPGITGDEALLGMSFLARFEIVMNGDEMRIRRR